MPTVRAFGVLLFSSFSREQFVTATFLNALRQVIAAVGIALQTRALRFIDPAEGGIWLIYLTTVSAGMIFEFGISSMVLRELGWDAGRSAREGTTAEIQSTFLALAGSVNRFTTFITLIASAVAMTWYITALRSVHVTPLFIAVIIGVSFGLSSALQMRSFFLQSVISGFGMPMPAVCVRLVSITVAHGACLVFIRATNSVLLAVVLWPLASSMEIALLHFVLARYHNLRRAPLIEAWQALKNRIKGAAAFALTGGFSTLTQASIPYFVGLGTGPAGVRAYTTAVLAAQGIQALVNQGISFYTGRLAYLMHSEHGSVRKDVIRGLALVSAAIVLLQVVVIFIGKAISAWLNEGTGVFPGAPLIALAAIAYSADSIGHYARMIVWCLGRWPFMKYYVIQFIIVTGVIGARVHHATLMEMLVVWAASAVILTLVPTMIVLQRSLKYT